MHDGPTIEGVFVMDTPLNSPQIRRITMDRRGFRGRKGERSL
jgi:hypothetical protein